MRTADGAARVERIIEVIARDDQHGAGYLARKALGVLSLAAREQRPQVAARLAALRPEMPTIAAAVAEAMAAGDIRATIRRSDAERRRVARSAARSLHRLRVATISNSGLVARALVYGSPALTQVVVASPDDEGWLLVGNLRAAGLNAETVAMEEVDSQIAVIGCEAVFADGTFVGRAGTRALVDRLPTLVLVDRWKRVHEPPPSAWPVPRRFELVPGDGVRGPA